MSHENISLDTSFNAPSAFYSFLLIANDNLLVIDHLNLVTYQTQTSVEREHGGIGEKAGDQARVVVEKDVIDRRRGSSRSGTDLYGTGQENFRGIYFDRNGSG